MNKPTRAPHYAEYLHIPELLSLQRPLTKVHDEMQFIVVHQVYELWFKLTVHSVEGARTAMRTGDLVTAVHLFQRAATILRTATLSWPVIETMHPVDFLAFRHVLNPASGFQSLQFRELEYVGGLRDPRYLTLFRGPALARLKSRLREPSLWDVYLAVLARRGVRTARPESVRAAVIQAYSRPDTHPLGPLTGALFDLDQSFADFRHRHIQMTMRMIGSRPGTGQKDVGKLVAAGYDKMGSGGVDYLKTTLDRVFFPVLWEARTLLEKRRR